MENIGLEEAIESAISFSRSLPGDLFLGSIGIRLEEVEIGEEEYSVTLSLYNSKMASFNLERHYKIFKIDSKTGKVKSMKNRFEQD